MFEAKIVGDQVQVQAQGTVDDIAANCCILMDAVWHALPDGESKAKFLEYVTLALTDPNAPMFDNGGTDHE